jgi:hypothetical protein
MARGACGAVRLCPPRRRPRWPAAPSRGCAPLAFAVPHLPATRRRRVLLCLSLGAWPALRREQERRCLGHGAAPPGAPKLYRAAAASLGRAALAAPPAWRDLLGPGAAGAGRRGREADCVRRQYARAASRSMAQARGPIAAWGALPLRAGLWGWAKALLCPLDTIQD